MDALGRLFDISTGVVGVDFNTAGATGKRVSLRNATQVSIVALLGAAASGTESLVFTLRQHTASSAGTSQNLATVRRWWIKAATTLAGTETWTKVTQPASATVTVADTVGALTGVATKQAIVVVEVDAAQLSDGFGYVSLDVADPGAVARVGNVLYLLHDLTVARTPENLVAPLS